MGWKEQAANLKALGKRVNLTNDGCSSAPDGSWKQCCVEHDYYYRNPVELTGVDRREADSRLHRCMRCKAGSLIACLYWVGVRACGWIPWGKAGKAAKAGDVSCLNPPKPTHITPMPDEADY